MPSQRLLKMLDPEGHLAPRSVIADARPGVVVWAGTTLREWIAGAVRRAGGTPLLATAFRHVAWSLRPEARPAIGLAILDHAALSAVDASSMAAFRWSGYRGRIILVGKAPVDRQLSAVLEVDAWVRPHDAEHPLDAVIARMLPA